MAAPPSETDWTGALLGGRYRLSRCLGRGGMGAVYEAKQEDLGRRVAVKVLHEHLAGHADVLARFRREAQAAAALGHPNIVQVTDFQQRPGEPPFLVMEHLVGASLATTINEQGPLSQVRVAFVAQQMLSALAAAHSAGIIHRDLKPDNVFLTSISGVDDIVKLLDFGVVKLLQPDGPDANLTTTGAAIGTPVYMAPEQARGRGVDARTDLYATGVCMYEALTARLPHDPPSYSALIAAILEEPPRALSEHRPDVDPALAAIVHRALEKDPARRFQSADEMRRAVEPFARASVAGSGLRTAAVAGPARIEAQAAPTVLGASGAAGAQPRASSPEPVALPKTAEQAVVPPTITRDAMDVRHAERLQRGTPVTASRTLARPGGSTRWPLLLAAAAIVGGACVGTGLFVTTCALGPPPPPPSLPRLTVRAPAEPLSAEGPTRGRHDVEQLAQNAVGPSAPPDVSPAVPAPAEPALVAVPNVIAPEPVVAPSSLGATPSRPRNLRPVPAVAAAPGVTAGQAPVVASPPPVVRERPRRPGVDVALASVDVGETHVYERQLRLILGDRIQVLRHCFVPLFTQTPLDVSYAVDLDADGEATISPVGYEHNVIVDACLRTAVRMVHFPRPARPGRIGLTFRVTSAADAPPAGG